MIDVPKTICYVFYFKEGEIQDRSPFKTKYDEPSMMNVDNDNDFCMKIDIWLGRYTVLS